ncbi:MAG: fibro-slime domain-containing protein [Chitinispirillaceae bacterium]|nr:fibro-slime domain-containing protein [Chitinispirillaceae bacterium]
MRRKSDIYRVNAIVLSFLLSAVSGTFHFAVAQSSYPAILKVPVTFYDFHSDSSNPEFEISPPGSAVKTGMVAGTLDMDKKPALGTSPFFNRRIDRWFRPWSAGDFTIYNYYGENEDSGEFHASRFDRYSNFATGLITLSHDTSFKNTVIQDTLEFRYVQGSAGMYEYNNDNFFPLDGRGFGAEGREHNYSFTMELHWTFTMVPGLAFNFTGDDDVWAFVNNKQVLDIGGIHRPEWGSFSVDNISGLVPNQQYSFDLFYAERHVTGSNIRISTNIIAPPSDLRVYDNPNPPSGNNQPVTEINNVKTGKAITVYGHVFDSAGVWRPEFDSLITWRVESGVVQLSSNRGSSVTLTADEPLGGSEFVIVATFKDPANSSLPASEARVTVRMAKGSTDDPPQEPVEDHLDIVLDSLAGRAKETGFTTFSFPLEEHTQELYVVVRDPKGNFIRFAELASWQSSNTQVVTLSPISGLKTVITKGPDGLGHQALIIVNESGLKPDSLTVLWRGNERQAVVPNPFVPGKVDIKTVLPQSVLNNFTPVIEAAGTPYITLVGIQTAEQLRVFQHGSTESLPLQVNDSYGEVKVYDAVGNLIRSDLRLVAARNKLTYGVAWNGTNRSGRVVGTGAYLMVITAVSEQGRSYSIKEKIGVKNKR